MEDRYLELIKIINEADYNYHTLDNPTITDQEYDSYLRELYEIEEKNPDIVRDDSPSHRAGGKVLSEFNKITHKIKVKVPIDKREFWHFRKKLSDKYV